MNTRPVTVVIPIHLEKPTPLEIVSLDQTLEVLKAHPITLMAPIHLNTAWYEQYWRGKADVSIERFDWKGYEGFGCLMTSPEFYGRFRSFKYILICHLDAFVFRDELLKWCDYGYDYIGAYIYNPAWNNNYTRLRRLLGYLKPEYFGNGGFALKKVDTFYRITRKFKIYIDAYHWQKQIRKHGFLDDIFLITHFPRLDSKFKMAPKLDAQRFGAAYEMWAENQLPFDNADGSSLPFGIHGWISYNQDYWRPPIRTFGHAV